jgi:nucleotide-binding universal stress UspA family protein
VRVGRGQFFGNAPLCRNQPRQLIAKVLAKRFGAKLYAVHVRPISIGPLMVPGGEPGAAEAARVDAEQRTKQIVASFAETRPEVLLLEGDVWSNIEDTLASRDIDLLVTGTRGRSGVAKLFLGSVAEELFRKATCAVLTVGPHSHAHPNVTGEIKKILFATNLSPRSAAAPYAIPLAQEFQARLILLHVTDPEEVPDVPRSQNSCTTPFPRTRSFGAILNMWSSPAKSRKRF